jgi:hypothetical protein
MIDQNEFPTLPIKTDDNRIQDTICRIWINLSRKNSVGLRDINCELFELLLYLKSKVRTDSSYMKYLELLFCMVSHTRDIAFGRGERDITYGMIYSWHRVFPILAVVLIKMLVQSSGPNDLTYGSWKDIARLCDYIKQETGKDDHNLILTSIEIANRQLHQDIVKLRISGAASISNVSKWIPREKSKYGWLFDMFVKDFYPRMMHNLGDDFEKRMKSFTWHKSKYRKMISELNAHNRITEIKQCQNNWSHIDFFNEDVSQESFKKYWKAFMNQNSNLHCLESLDRVECSQHALHYAQLKFSGLLPYHNKNNPAFFYGKNSGVPRSDFYSMSEFIKRAVELVEKRKLADTLSLDHIINQYQTNLINAMWNKFSERVKKNIGSTIPILDVSLTMTNSDEFYSAIGYAYLISENSDIKNRMIAFSHNVEWISWDGNNFVDNIFTIMKHLPSSTSKRFDGVVTLLETARLSSGYALDNINFVLLSDFCEQVEMVYPLKNIVYWNMSSGYVSLLDYSRLVVSGSSLSSFCQLCNILSTNITQFDLIQKTLGHLRYARTREYFRKITDY